MRCFGLLILLFLFSGLQRAAMAASPRGIHPYQLVEGTVIDDNGNPIGLTPGTTWVALPRQGTATVR